MYETVIFVREDLDASQSRLADIVDAFARRRVEEGPLPGDSFNIIMTTLREKECLLRKLVFETDDQALQFLTFWRDTGQVLEEISAPLRVRQTRSPLRPPFLPQSAVT